MQVRVLFLAPFEPLFDDMSRTTLRAASRVRTTPFDENDVVEMARSLRKETGGAAIAFVFATGDWLPELAEVTEIIQVEGHARQVAGCSASGVIGTGRECENVSGISILFLNSPASRIDSWVIDENFRIPPDRPPDGGWIILGNPLSLNAPALLEDLNQLYPRIPAYGGMAGGVDPSALFTFSHQDPSGRAAGVAVHIGGDIRISGIVSQGCQPIGEPYTITRVEEDMVLGVGGRRAFDVLVETFEKLPEEERRIARGNIMAGLAASEYRDEFRSGDFLIRNILGGDSKSGALKIGAQPRVGQTIQFQLREREAASSDLRMRCTAHDRREGKPGAALIFSCSGRGQHLFGAPNHDASMIEETFGPVPAAGFFCNGEFGPVAGLNFVHGYTASVAMFYGAAQ